MLASPAFAQAEDLGVVGPSYPVKEPDLLEAIQARLAEKQRTGEIQRLQREAANRARNLAESPPPAPGVKTTSAARVFFYDPAFTAPKEVRGPDGEVLVAAGTRVNPLDYVGLSRPLYFFDGRDGKQLRMALAANKRQPGGLKLIMTAGKRMSVNQELLRSNPDYYFDTQVKRPSMLYVSLNGKHWYVNGDGNHRTCLARYHFERLNALGFETQTMIHGVTIDDYRVDWKLFDAFLKLKEALRAKRPGDSVEGYRFHTGREDGPAWKIDRYEPQIKHVSSNGKETILGLDKARELLSSLGRPMVGGLLRWMK